MDEIKKLANKISKVPGTSHHRFAALESFHRRWTKFFGTEEFCKKTDTILDFGCAAGFSIFTARKFGFNNVKGIDVHRDNPVTRMRDEVSRIIGTYNDITRYVGYGRLPYDDNTFDVMIAADAMGKDSTAPKHDTDERTKKFIERMNELVRISKPNSKWYIRGPKHLKYTQEMYEELKLGKNITIQYLEIDKKW